MESGFNIVDGVNNIPTDSCSNYKLVYTGEANDYISDLIMSEIAAGKYMRADFVPQCVHAIGAIPKNDYIPSDHRLQETYFLVH